MVKCLIAIVFLFVHLVPTWGRPLIGNVGASVNRTRPLFGLCLFLSGLFAFNSYASEVTYACTDWYEDGKKLEGTTFVAEKLGNNFIVKNRWKSEIVLKFLGKYNNTGVSLYKSYSPKYDTISIFAIGRNVSRYDLEKKFSYLEKHQTSTNCVRQ